jgi:hypothetical protein
MALEARMIENEAAAQSFAGTLGIASAFADRACQSFPGFMYRYQTRITSTNGERCPEPGGRCC